MVPGAGIKVLKQYTKPDANSSSSVARIAYLSSDVVVSVQPSNATDSTFSTCLNKLSGNGNQGIVANTARAVPEVRHPPWQE